MNQPSSQRAWETQIKALARQVNLGWWLSYWQPWMLGLAIASAMTLLALRALAIPHEHWLMMSAALLTLITGCFAWWRARASFESVEQTRVRLEDAMQLHTRLTSAASGVGEWPPFETVPSLMRWKWQRPLAATAASIALVLFAAWVPLASLKDDRPRIIEKPAAVKQVEQWVEELRKENAIDPKNLDEVEKKIEELLRRPNDQWYEHASLEAADHLRDETGKNLQELGSQLEQTQGSLSSLAALGSKLGEEAKSGMAKQAKDNLNALRSGAMAANSDLMDQLKNMDPKALGNMSQEQLQKLANRLKQNADALRKALANAPQFDFKECKGNKPGECDKPGQGGVTKGRGDAELTVKQDETNLHQKRTEAASNLLDPERMAPGDLLGLQDAKPSTDEKSFTGPTQGGALQSNGEGGAAVERASLIPAERAALKRFFK